MGSSIAEGLYSFSVGYEEYEELLKERRISRHRKRPPTAYINITEVFEGKLYFEPEIDQIKRS